MANPRRKGMRLMYKHILDSLVVPVLMADTEHVMVYMNKAAEEQYKNRGGKALLGRSLFDCHNDDSNRIIKEVFRKMQHEGLEEELTHDGDKKRIYMRAVRAEDGELIGYYERYEYK